MAIDNYSDTEAPVVKEEIVEIPVSQYITRGPDDIDNEYHIVKNNDLLWRIVTSKFPSATHEEVNQYINDLAALNNISNPDLIYVGDTMRMPKRWNIKQ